MPDRADMDRKTEDGLTPLALAAQGGHVDVVRFLCEAGADLAALPVTGPSALSSAVNSSCKDLAWEASCPSGVTGRGKKNLGKKKAAPDDDRRQTTEDDRRRRVVFGNFAFDIIQV